MTIVVLKISSLYGCDGYTTDVYDHIKWYVAWRPTLEKDNILILFYQYEISLSRGISEIYDWHSSPLPNPRLPPSISRISPFSFSPNLENQKRARCFFPCLPKHHCCRPAFCEISSLTPCAPFFRSFVRFLAGSCLFLFHVLYFVHQFVRGSIS